MKKIILNNGLTLVCCEKNVRKSGYDYLLSVTFGGGHITEPRLGVASLYEKLVTSTDGTLRSFCGGDITSLYTGGKEENLGNEVRKLFLNCRKPRLGIIPVSAAIKDIVKHTEELAPLPERQTKLAYKHTAFSQDNVVWDTEAYIREISTLTAADVREYIAQHLVGANTVIGFTGPARMFDQVRELVEEYFGELPVGEKKHRKDLLYTGGYQTISSNGTTNIAMFGWDLVRETNFSKVNVLMSLLSARLERDMASAKIAANPIVKIAGYYGFRTLRVSISCAKDADFKKAINIVCKNVARLRDANFVSNASIDAEVEMARNRAMTERLALPDDRLPRSIEAAWLMLGRGKDYNNNACIDGMWIVDAYDVRDTAQVVFAQKLTAVLYTSTDCPSAEELFAQMQ